MTYAGRPVLIIRPNFDQLVANVMDDVTSDNHFYAIQFAFQIKAAQKLSSRIRRLSDRYISPSPSPPMR